MGLFATFIYAEDEWTVEDEPESDAVFPAGPFLAALVHDSDFVEVAYSPAPDGGGNAYLGFQPRDYFEDPTASDDVDLDLEAEGLAQWASAVTSTSVSAAAIRALLADEGVEEPVDDFAEETLARLIVLLGLPVPSELTEE